jgi:hypothetical protein
MNRSYLIILSVFLTELFLSGQEPVSPLRYSFPSYQQLKREAMFNLDLIAYGPVGNSVRADCIKIDPGNSWRIYVGISSGNIWKTTTNGFSWKPVLKGISSTGIGDFAITPSNPEIMHLGTDDNLKKHGNFTFQGDGTYILHLGR